MHRQILNPRSKAVEVMTRDDISSQGFSLHSVFTEPMLAGPEIHPQHDRRNVFLSQNQLGTNG